MLSLLKRLPKAEALAPVQEAGPLLEMVPEPARRNRQENIKASDDCRATFAAIAKAQGMSKAALFEDMVAARLEELQRRGIAV